MSTLPTTSNGKDNQAATEISTTEQARVVRKVDNAVHRIHHYLADSVVCFVLDSDLSLDSYPAFEQLTGAMPDVYGAKHTYALPTYIRLLCPGA